MHRFVKEFGRLLPRSVRNFLRAPGRSFRWWWQERQADVPFSPCVGWSLHCPKTAIEGAFHLQLDDPPQVAEFVDFMQVTETQRDPVFFDIGCHYGLFSFAVADRCGPGTRVVAVDPSAAACAMVRRISSRNGWDTRIQVLCAAMGERVGELEMVNAGVMSAGYFVLPTDQPTRDRVRVAMRTIDELAAEFGKPDMIKVDVEGFEGEVLRGGEQTLSQGSCVLFLELHNGLMRGRGVDPGSVLKQLTRLGYFHFVSGGKTVGESEILEAEIVRIIARRAVP